MSTDRLGNPGLFSSFLYDKMQRINVGIEEMDDRKKYDLSYFRNRFFKDQFLMAERCYRPQMQTCDLVVDTTGAAVWTTPEIARTLSDIV